MKTFNRGKLKRLVQAGRIVMEGSYHFDDMLGGERTSGQALPVRIRQFDEERKPGVVELSDHDFKSKSGCCYESGPGLVTLIVHSNCNYTFRILPENAAVQS